MLIFVAPINLFLLNIICTYSGEKWSLKKRFSVWTPSNVSLIRLCTLTPQIDLKRSYISATKNWCNLVPSAFLSENLKNRMFSWLLFPWYWPAVSHLTLFQHLYGFKSIQNQSIHDINTVYGCPEIFWEKISWVDLLY